MTTRDDILAIITEGRLDAQRARATALSRALTEVEGMVRKMRPTPEPVTIESGNTADLADLEAMRDILDGADWPPTPLGLSEALKRADEADELDRRHAEALATISDLRAQIAALTPGPWVRSEDGQPGLGDWVLIQRGHAEPFVQRMATGMHIAPGVRWLRIPDGDPAT